MQQSPASTLERALVILYHCAAHADGSSFSELKSIAGNVASMTLSRILNSLTELGDLCKDEQSGLYKTGPRFMKNARLASGQLSLDEILMPVVKQLALKCNEPAAYFHWDQEWIYLRLKHELPENFTYAPLGSRNHPISHTFYRAVQSGLNKQQLKRIDVQDLGMSDTELAEISNDGYFIQLEQYRYPVFRVTAPVFYGSKNVAGAIGITSLINDLDEKEVQQLIHNVRESAHQASGLLATMEQEQ